MFASVNHLIFKIMQNSINVCGVIIRKNAKGATGGKFVLEIPSKMDGKALAAWKLDNREAIAAAKAELSEEGDRRARE